MTTRRRGPTRAQRRRRRIALVIGVALLAGLAATVVLPLFDTAVREVTLPLRHEDVIRQQAAEKELDPALIAAIIYAESRFRDQTSPAGARGLMQITPETSRYIARLSGGTQFEEGDLATPQINISYGAFYLRYLLDRYDENEVLALAAYNGGEGNVDRWTAAAAAADREFDADEIPFPETRAYVDTVLEVREQYADRYPVELGLR